MIDEKVYSNIADSVYSETEYGYNSVGEENRVVDASGDITRMVFDPRGLTLSIYVGTADAGATDTDPTGGRVGLPTAFSTNNMLPVESYVYDTGQGGGDGNLTSSTAYVDADSADDRVTDYGYNLRDEQIWTLVDDHTLGSNDLSRETYTFDTYDNLGRVTNETRYYDLTDTLPHTAPNSGDPIIGESGTNYDNLGRVYQTLDYNPSGTVATVVNTFFDPDGNVIETQAGGTQEFVKNVYDGLGDPIHVYDGYDPTGSESWASAGSVAGDVILNETDTLYDPAGDAILVTSFDSFNDSSTAAGALNDTDSRASYTAYWYDGVGRETAQQDFGAMASPPLIVPADGQPTTDTSGLTQVTLTAYNARGEAWQTTDPAGTVTRTICDDAGRTIDVVQNYAVDVNGNPLVAPVRTSTPPRPTIPRIRWRKPPLPRMAARRPRSTSTIAWPPPPRRTCSATTRSRP